MQHKIPKQVKLILWAVKKDSGEKEGVVIPPRCLVGRGRPAVFFFLDLAGDYTGVFTLW